MDSANRRLNAIQRALAPNGGWKRVLVLPDHARVDVSPAPDAAQPTNIAIEGTVVGLFRTLPRSLALIISAVGTPHEKTADHVPKFSLLEILPPAAVDASAPATISIPDLWAIVYTLHTILHTQETIPIVLSPDIQNAAKLSEYLLVSGLARKRHTLPSDTATAAAEPEHFLLRETFWQGAGTVSYHTRGWLRGQCAQLAGAPFPYTQSFTRTPLVIAAHPLRPPKPRPGEVIYRRWIPSLGQMLEFTYFDLEGHGPGVECEGESGVSLHLATFHRWHNSDHVNRGWGERGPLEKHRAYVRDLMADPCVLPVMMSWDSELMGYAEMVYIKENHVAPYVPGGAWDYDRGLHVLVGEEKFRGIHRSKGWFANIHHFLFLSDPRTERVIGEPKAANAAVIRLSEAVGMNVNTVSVPAEMLVSNRVNVADTEGRRYSTSRTSGRR
ncbi:acyl-CoA N-acyltransferase [Trametes elegans]|nr:acyl-CoA N-acyltransferase [Trametes elegans]